MQNILMISVIVMQLLIFSCDQSAPKKNPGELIASQNLSCENQIIQNLMNSSEVKLLKKNNNEIIWENAVLARFHTIDSPVVVIPVLDSEYLTFLISLVNDDTRKHRTFLIKFKPNDDNEKMALDEDKSIDTESAFKLDFYSLQNDTIRNLNSVENNYFSISECQNICLDPLIGFDSNYYDQCYDCCFQLVPFCNQYQLKCFPCNLMRIGYRLYCAIHCLFV